MITFEGVSKWYHAQLKVLDQVRFDLKPRDFLYLIGGTGAGKTSLIRMMATEDRPSGGKVKIFGFDISTMSPSTLRSVRRRIGYIPQDVRLIDDLSVYDNVALSIRLGPKKVTPAEEESRVMELLRDFGLLSKRNRWGGELSGGEKQRVAAARALARNPEILIADEPTGAQDRGFTWALMEQLVRANRSGATVIVATHDREIVQRVRQRCATIRGGKVILEDQRCIY